MEISEVAIAVPGSAGPRDFKNYFTGVKHTRDLSSDIVKEYGQEKTLGVLLDATGIPQNNRFVLQYPQNLNIVRPILTGGDLARATNAERDSFYGRSLDIGVRALAQLVETIAISVQLSKVRLILAGYSQGAEIVQIFMASSENILTKNVHKWLLDSLEVSVLLANPVRGLRDNTKHISLEKNYDRNNLQIHQNESRNDGSLFVHRRLFNLDLSNFMRERTVNIFWDQDIVASCAEDKRKGLSRIINTIKKTNNFHVDYRDAKLQFESIFKEKYFFGKDSPSLKIISFPDSANSLEGHPLYILSKQYLLSRTGVGALERQGFFNEAEGKKDERLRSALHLQDDDYGEIGKVVQAAVWTRAADLIASALHEEPYYANIQKELRGFLHLGVIGPAEFSARVAEISLRNPAVPTAFRGEADSLAIDGNPNGATISLMRQWFKTTKLDLPEWLTGKIRDSQNDPIRPWSGDPETVGIEDFIQDAIKSTTPKGSNFKQDVYSLIRILNKI